MRSLPLLLAATLFSCHPGGERSEDPALTITVSPDGRSDYRTVQEAFNAVPDSADRWTEIVLRPGVYKEKLTLRASKRRVILRGETPGTAILSYDDHTGRVVGNDTINTRTSFSCSLEGDDLRVEGVTFRNTAGRVGQAVALQITGDRIVLDRCRILGDQDTFFARGIGRVYLRDCEIEGTTDFIFGSAIVLFDRCLIRSKKDSYITAASTPEGNAFGFVFRECTLVAEEGIAKVHLGRPWRPFAKSVFLRCDLGPHILPVGWHNWSKPDAERTALYAEYRCSGPGSDRSSRVPWSRELTEEEASDYTAAHIFGARSSSAPFAADWLPAFDVNGPVWSPDNGDGSYSNPIIYSDYSDPDAIRVGDDFYMTASSFSSAPGLPLLQSRDLVNWRIIGHALPAVPPADSFQLPQYGKGVWAPALRFRNGEFRIYYGDPDNGIFLVTARRPEGPWDPPRLIRRAKGWIDPSPFWDTDGSAYLIHAWAKSRVGFNSILTLHRMNPEGTAILDDGVTVFDGHAGQPTIEGPKLYSRDGYYYIFAPAGGVKAGWQTVLRAREIFGPYKDRIVMDQGRTSVNGPHQGAWLELPTGESWFIHFQERGAYGRIIHLQPMRWADGWPVIGNDPDGDGRGEPVLRYRKPAVAFQSAIQVPQTSDEFENGRPGLQWQWAANPRPEWIGSGGTQGELRLSATPLPEGARNLRDAPQLLLQKLPAPRFTMTVRCTPLLREGGGSAGLVVMGMGYAALRVTRSGTGWRVAQVVCPDANRMGEEVEVESVQFRNAPLVLRLEVTDGGRCRFSASEEGAKFTPLGKVFEAKPESWIGAKAGLFAVGNGAEFLDVDWVRFSPPASPW